MPDPSGDDTDPATVWWLRRMRKHHDSLHEKMVLFWHSHIASSADKASADMMARQHNMFRRHALGNFRELIHAVVHDAAMLVFLDGAGSQADAPNENLARELMELVTLGRGAYTEADVRAGAKALAGFTVDWESEAVGFNEEVAHVGRLTFLGVTDHIDADRLVDIICDQSACASFIVAKLYRFFVGIDPTEERANDLAAGFRESGLEIAPLVEGILRGDEFADQRMSRPRFPIEWFVATHLAFGLEVGDDEIWSVADLGQQPLYPPNVAGWQVGPQWIGSGRQLLRASLALSSDPDRVAVDFGGGDAEARARAALAHCGIFEPSATTVAGLRALAENRSADDGGDQLLVALAMASPEASCC